MSMGLVVVDEEPERKADDGKNQQSDEETLAVGSALASKGVVEILIDRDLAFCHLSLLSV